MDFLSSVFDPTSVDFLESIECGAYKIASPELVDVPLIEYTASKGKPMIISCGMGSMEEIQDAVDACRREGNEQIVLLKCTSEYPAVYEDMNIATMADMRERFGFPVGLRDSMEAMAVDVAAATLGASVIEKHFCITRDEEPSIRLFHGQARVRGHDRGREKCQRRLSGASLMSVRRVKSRASRTRSLRGGRHRRW